MRLFGQKEKKERKKIEVVLTRQGIIIRLIFFVIFLSIASYAFYQMFTKALHTESGWQMITANTKSEVGNDFAFNYQIGVSGMSASQEWGSLNKVYPTLLNQGANIFGSDKIDGIGNLYALNSHPNEEVYLEAELYEALEKIETAGSRIIFYAPVFMQYRSLYLCDNEYAELDFDPFASKEASAYVHKLCDFAGDDEHIRIELLGNQMAKLVVSDEYLSFAKENEIEKLIDLYFAKNAFLIDYVADKLIEKGYKAGVITSVEGFVRALGEGNYSIKRYCYEEGNTPKEDIYSYNGPKSLVSLRDFSMYGEDNKYCFTVDDGSMRHIFIDPETGLSRSGIHQVLAQSETMGCSDILLPLFDAFVNGEEALAKLNQLAMTVEY